MGESGFGRLNGELGIREFTVPTHVAATPMLSLGRMWWYPYDEATNTALRAIVDVLSAPDAATKAKGLRNVLSNGVKAMKGKF